MVLKMAGDQKKLAENQVNLVDQMLISVERFFGSLEALQDEANDILTDWTS